MPEFPEIPLGRGKIFIPIGDGTEMMDTLYPFFRLPEEGYEVVVAGPDARTRLGTQRAFNFNFTTECINQNTGFGRHCN